MKASSPSSSNPYAYRILYTLANNHYMFYFSLLLLLPRRYLSDTWAGPSGPKHRRRHGCERRIEGTNELKHLYFNITFFFFVL
jgi:hypothetical protein